LASGWANDSLTFDVTEVREEIVLIEFVFGDTKKAAKKVGA
jgi:hypothetical protein